jgi:vacuolar protein sorting-associated protein 35
MQGAEHDAVFTSAEEQEKWLADAMALVQHHAFYMHRALDANNIRDVLKFSAQMLSELRTSKLSPQKYYELCIPSSSFPSFLPWIQQF